MGILKLKIVHSQSTQIIPVKEAKDSQSKQSSHLDIRQRTLLEATDSTLNMAVFQWPPVTWGPIKDPSSGLCHLLHERMVTHLLIAAYLLDPASSIDSRVNRGN